MYILRAIIFLNKIENAIIMYKQIHKRTTLLTAFCPELQLYLHFQQQILNIIH